MLTHIALFTCLLLECSIVVSSTIVISQPTSGTIWTPGNTYEISVKDDKKDKDIKSWQVDLIVLGGECDGICLHDGIVAEISKVYSTQSRLQFKVPTNIVQHGKGFHIQFSNAGVLPIYQSATFSIEKLRSKRHDEEAQGAAPEGALQAEEAEDDGAQQLQKRDISAEVDGRKSENAAPFVLPAVLATTAVLGFSCVFAFFMI